MHRSFLSLSLAVTAALIVNGPAYAQHGHGGGKPTTTPTSHAPSSTHGSSGTTHGQSGSHGPATKPTSSTHGSGTTHASGGGNTHGTGKPSTSNATSTTTATSNPPNSGAGPTTTLSPVQQKLQTNTNLADKLRGRLPKNTDLMAAADGFKNLGQFVAAVNVSNNLGLDFTELKTRMVDDHMSLGQAIQDTKKTADVDTEVRRAQTEADSMIKSTSSTTSSTSNTSTTTTKTRKTNGTK